MGSTLHITNESNASWTRSTKHGRKITYTMNVIQHPAQARACGLGSKSNTDRRPVDPPPILDLHVYEGEGSDMTDVTFAYKANFFVWASLEYARPMAHGRGSQSSINTPVLCGTPVAGISYLDRPTPAGYFIFPDLSVRHEGSYRINFTLYEDLKDPEYEDESTSQSVLDAGNMAECVNCRCEVRSVQFQVFSAKKFPGLSESTSLSRMVAEQGCRVRIRRDVRMRKRDTKNSRDWDDYEDDTADQRVKQNATPTVGTPAPKAPTPSDHGADSRNRIRSNSVASNASAHHPHSSMSQPVPDWMPQDTARSYSGMSHSTQHVPSPAAPYFHHGLRPSQEPPQQISTHVPAQYISEQQMAQSPQNMANPYMSSLAMQGHSPWPYGPQSQMHSPVYGQPVNHLRHNSIQYPTPSPHEYQPHPIMNNQYDAHLAQNGTSFGMTADTDAYGRQTQSHASYSNERPGAMAAQVSAPYAMELPPLRHSASQSNFERPQYNEQVMQYPQSGNFVAPAVPPEYVTQSTGHTSQKRSYGSVFNTQSMEGPLRSGARPDPYSNMPNVNPDNHSSSDDDSLETEGQLTMQYRRADGTIVDRRWPAIS